MSEKPAPKNTPENAPASGRDAAILRGRLLGEHEADRRGESSVRREERLQRAMAYAAWDFDGRPSGGAHLREFQVGVEITPSLERAVFGRLLKKKDKTE